MAAKDFKHVNQNVTDAEVVKRVKSAITIDIEKKKAMNIPIAVFDAKSGNIYAEYNDGKRVLMGSRLKRGNYGKQGV